MRNLYICIILIIFSLSAITRGEAQNYHLTESGAVLKGPGQEILPLPGGGIVTVTHPRSGRKGPMTISRFDNDLIQIYSVRLSLLSHERYQSAWFYNDTLLLFTIDAAGGLTRYQVDIDRGSLTGQPQPLTGMLGIDQPMKQVSFYAGGSADSGSHYIVSAAPRQKSSGRDLRGILLNRQGEKVTFFHYPLPASAVAPIAFTQANDGTLAFIYTSPDKDVASRYVPNAAAPPKGTDRYTVTAISPDGTPTSFRLSGLPEGRMHYTSWAMQGGTLCFSGWMSESGKTGLTTILTGCVDLGTGIVFGLRQTELTSLMATSQGAQPGKLQNELPAELAFLRSISLPDGSRYLLFENSGPHLYQHRFSLATENPVAAMGHTSGFPSLSASNEAVCYLSRGNVYVLRLDAADKPQWLNVLSKNQEEWGQVVAIGTGSLLDRENRLHIFFYDNKANSKPTASEVTPFRADEPQGAGFACISISPDGAMKKQFIHPTDNGYRLMPELAFVDTRDQACFLAIHTNRYKVGTIALK
ncbi:MAG TPA: hypothetical protein VGM89_01105 [Puia sp.]